MRLLQRLGYWKVDCSRIRDKNKESKTEVNPARVINTQSGSTSQAGGLDLDLGYSLSQPLILPLLLR